MSDPSKKPRQRPNTVGDKPVRRRSMPRKSSKQDALLPYKNEEQDWFSPVKPQTEPVDGQILEQFEPDVLVSTATPTERDAVLRRMLPLEGHTAIAEVRQGHYTYYAGRIARHTVILVKSAMGTSAPRGSLLAGARAVEAWNPLAAIAVGLAYGADPDKLKIGDVLVSTRVNLYDPKKVHKGETINRGSSVDSGPSLIDRFENVPSWSFLRPDGTEVNVQPGQLLSGETLVNDLTTKRELLSRYPESIGGEMEGAGLYAVAADAGVQWIIVKAVCDWGDGTKNSRYQPLAAAAAVSLLEHVLSKPDALDGMRRPHLSKKEQAPKAPGQRQELADTEHSRRADTPRAKRYFGVPLHKNPYFVNRETILAEIERTFSEAADLAIVVLYGLPGVGKTQIASKYAYLHRDDYDVIVWARAESIDEAAVEFAKFAKFLEIPDEQADSRELVIGNALTWFETNGNWLLILDGAVSPAVVSALMPRAALGHILLATKSREVSTIGQAVEVPLLNDIDAELLLLRRARIIDSNTNVDAVPGDQRVDAQAICAMLGNLPLAIDQAGAYIAETPLKLKEYISLYNSYGEQLRKRRGGSTQDHASVYITFSMAYEAVEKGNPSASALLRLCAFYSPQAIPIELFQPGFEETRSSLRDLVEPGALAAALAELNKWSLVSRDLDQDVLNVHIAVQEVMVDLLPKKKRKKWARRAIAAYSSAFPYVEHTTWPACFRLLPHAPSVLRWVRELRIWSHEILRALNQIGAFYLEQGYYAEAAEYLDEAYWMAEEMFGEDSVNLIQYLNNLSVVLEKLDQFERAEQVISRALEISGKSRSTDLRETSTLKNNLGLVLLNLRRHREAAAAFREALAGDIDEKARAQYLDSLSKALDGMGLSNEAMSLLRQALALREKLYSSNDPKLAEALNNLGVMLSDAGSYQEAGEKLERALAIMDSNPSLREHPERVVILCNLGILRERQGLLDDAEKLFFQAREILENRGLTSSLGYAQVVKDIGGLYYRRGEYAQAERSARQALEIAEKVFGTAHPAALVPYLTDLATTLRANGGESEAVGIEGRISFSRAQQAGASDPPSVLANEKDEPLAIQFEPLRQPEAKEMLVMLATRTDFVGLPRLEQTGFIPQDQVIYPKTAADIDLYIRKMSDGHANLDSYAEMIRDYGVFRRTNFDSNLISGGSFAPGPRWYLEKFEAAIDALYSESDALSVGRIISAVINGVASVEIFISEVVGKWNEENADNQIQFSPTGPDQFGESLDQCLSVVSSQVKFDRATVEWESFEFLLRLRSELLLRPSRDTLVRDGNELADVVNKFRYGVSGMLARLSDALGYEIPAIVVRGYFARVVRIAPI